MNTLKKTVAVVLAVAMVLTMGIATSFAAYSDVQSTAGYAEAVNILSNLGIITGYVDGTFKPNNTISRAEVAAIMVRALDLDPQPGPTVFSDVASDHWAAGYINTAYAHKVINGKGDGTFDPNGDVTYEQAVKMVVSALGYEPDVKTKGGWPTGYLAVASANKITTASMGTVGQPATRATVAKLVYNALEVGMMDQAEWGSNVQYRVYPERTLLARLGVEKIDAVVTESYYTKAAGNGIYDARDKSVTLTAIKNGTVYNGDEYDKGEPIAEFEEGGTAAASMLGYAVVAYVGVDDETDADTIYAISAKAARNTVITVKGDLLAGENELSTSGSGTTEADRNEQGTVYYWRNGRTDKRPASISPDDDGIAVYVNYDLDDENFFFEGKDYASAGTEFKNILTKGGIVQFIDNDGDGDYNVALVSKYDKEGVVDTVRVDGDGVYTFRGMGVKSGMPEAYDPEDDEVLKIFIKGESYIDPSEIAEGDTITTIGSEGEDKIIIYQVSSDKVEGRSNYDPESDMLVVGGKSYAKSPNLDKDLSGYKNYSGTFYLNADGLVSYVDGNTAATGNYGYVVGVNMSTDWNKDSYEIKIVDAAGNAQTYTIKSENVTIYDKQEKSHKEPASFVYALYEDADTVSPADRIVKYSVEGKQLTKLVLANSYDNIYALDLTKADRSYTYDEEERTIGASDSFTDATVVFTVGRNDDGEYMYDDEDYITVSTGTGKFIDGNEYSVVTFSESDTVVAALQMSGESDIALAQNVFVVSSYTTDINDDDENIITFRGIQNGTSRTFQLYNDADDYADTIAADNDLGKGTILLVGPENGGYVDKIEILVKVERDARANAVTGIENNTERVTKDNKKFIVTGYTTVSEYEAYDNKTEQYVPTDSFYGDNGYIQIAGEETSSTKGYRPASNTNVVLVDLTPSRHSAATVSTRDLSALDVSPARYAFGIFFRAYDVEDQYDFDLYAERASIKDIVLFKVNADDDYLLDGVTGQSYKPSTTKKPSSKVDVQDGVVEIEESIDDVIVGETDDVTNIVIEL